MHLEDNDSRLEGPATATEPRGRWSPFDFPVTSDEPAEQSDETEAAQTGQDLPSPWDERFIVPL